MPRPQSRLERVDDMSHHGVRRTRFFRRASFARGGGAVVIGVLLLLASATSLYAHLALRTASPAADGRLDAVPEFIRLDFTEPVELPLSMIVLTGPRGGAVTLGPLREGETREVVLADILDPLVPGSYSVSWQAVGRDGHPVRGEYTFEIEEDAEGLAIEQEELPVVDTAIAPAPTLPPMPTFSAQSPLYAGVRWLSYLGILGTIGAVGFALLLTGPTITSRGLPPDYRTAAVSGAAGLGLLATGVLAVALPLRLQAQSHALFGRGITGERFSVITDTPWGTAWLIQFGGIVTLLVAFFLAWRGMRAGWLLAAPGALAVAIAPAMSGHARAVVPGTAVAILSDTLHIIAVGFWLGTLLVILLVGIPLVRKLADGQRGATLATLVNGFSPLALVAAAVVVTTGAFASYLHLDAASDLWQTGYGRLLIAKLLLVAIVLAMGAYNWRKTRHRLAEPGGDARLMRSAGAELVAATVAIGLTAVLVAVPPPAQTPDSQRTPETIIEP
jgi:copper transport protein